MPFVVEKLQDFVFVFAIFVVLVLVQVVAVLVVAAAVVEFEVVAEKKLRFFTATENFISKKSHQ